MAQIFETTFVLTGAHKGKTIKLGKYPFKGGKLEVAADLEDTNRIARALERNFSAYPVGHPALKIEQETEDGERSIQTDPQPNSQPTVPSDVQPVGGGAETDPAAEVGSGPAKVDLTPAGTVPEGDGQTPILNKRLRAAVLGLDPQTDANWTISAIG